MNLASLTAYLTGPPHHVHLIGVAGSGMSGIAALLLALGHRVSGSDKVATVEVGREMADVLLRLIDGQRVHTVTMLPTTLIDRDSA